jgi:hypothetical protein
VPTLRRGLPFGVTVQPFKPLKQYPLDPLVQLESADAIARCGECFGGGDAESRRPT